MNNRLPFVPWGDPVVLDADGQPVRVAKTVGVHIAPQGPAHGSTPDSGSGTSGRGMLVVKSDPTGAGLGNQPWPVPSPPITPGDVWNPPAPADETPAESELIAGIWNSKWST